MFVYHTLRERHQYKNLPISVPLLSIVATLFGLLLYVLLRHALIKAAYESDSAIINMIMAGKQSTPLMSYLEAADDLVFTIAIALISLTVLYAAIILNPARTLLVVCSFAVCFIVAEVGVRLAFHDVTTTGDNSSYLARRWRKKIRENTMGFREREFGRERKEHVYRIAVIGDSFTWGQGISEEERFSNRLEQWLSQSRRTYEVLNFGRPGADTQDELRILHEHVLPLKPDFVMLQWYTNDVESLEQSRRKSGMRLIPSDYISARLRKNSLFFWLLEQQWLTLQETVGLKAFFEDALLVEFADPRKKAWNKHARTLRQFIDTCKQQSVTLGIVLFSDSYHRRRSKLDFLTDRVLKICQETLTECLDLRPAFANFPGDLKLWVNRLDAHPSAFANLIAAEQIFQKFGPMWLDRQFQPHLRQGPAYGDYGGVGH